MPPAKRSQKAVKGRKKQMRDCEYESVSKNTAELIKIDGEEIFIDNRSDIISRINGHRGLDEIGDWVADWAGCDGIKGFGVHGPTRGDVIEKMKALISRKKEFKALCDDIWKKRYGK